MAAVRAAATRVCLSKAGRASGSGGTLRVAGSVFGGAGNGLAGGAATAGTTLIRSSGGLVIDGNVLIQQFALVATIWAATLPSPAATPLAVP